MYIRKLRDVNYELIGVENRPYHLKYDDKKRTEDKIRTSKESDLSKAIEQGLWRWTIETKDYVLYYLKGGYGLEERIINDKSFIKFIVVDKETNYVIYESQRNSWPEFSEKYHMLKNIREIEKIKDNLK